MSAALRRDYLAAAIRERKTDGREFAAGRFDHVFDALAAGNVPLAGEIARLSPQAWRPQCEYEDDFCYAAVVHRLLAGAQWTGPSTQVLTGQFEKALEGQDSPRLTLISALARKDDAAFARGFEALLQQRQDEIAERMELGELEEPVVVAERQVFVEGLGLLFMADSIGVETQAEYLFCPSLARPPVPV